MMECLGLVKIHFPMRANPNRVLRWLPSQRIINAARVASEKMLRKVGTGMEGPLHACSIIWRREKAMEKRENMVQSGLREAAIRHQEYTEGATLYPMEKHTGHGMVCMVPSK